MGSTPLSSVAAVITLTCVFALHLLREYDDRSSLRPTWKSHVDGNYVRYTPATLFRPCMLFTEHRPPRCGGRCCSCPFSTSTPSATTVAPHPQSRSHSLGQCLELLPHLSQDRGRKLPSPGTEWKLNAVCSTSRSWTDLHMQRRRAR